MEVPMSTTEIAAVNRAFEEGVRKGDADRLAQLYTADAIALPPDGPFVRGRDAIRDLWSGVMRDMGLREVALETVDLEVAGDTACEVGEARLTLAPSSAAPSTVTVKYVVAWKKAGGRWQLHRDIWNVKP
jgi:uncharacterized protein (TIGR02246 family)